MNGHIPIDLLYNFILFILYSYHFINSLPPKHFSFIFHPPSYLHCCHSYTDRQIHRQTDTHTNTKIHTYKKHTGIHMHTRTFFGRTPTGLTFIIFVTTFYWFHFPLLKPSLYPFSSDSVFSIINVFLSLFFISPAISLRLLSLPH